MDLSLFVHQPALDDGEREILRQSRVAVTGAAGFLGQHVLRTLRLLGCPVRAVVRSDAPRHVDADVEVVRADLERPAECRSAVAGCSMVIHCAAQGGGLGANLGRDYELLTRNLAMSMNLYDAALQSGIERYLYVSSSAVYGRQTPQPLKEDEAGPPFLPAEHGFATAKWTAEEQLRLGSRSGRMHGVIVRPTNPYGPFDATDPAQAHFIPAVIMKLMRSAGAPLTLNGSGDIHRNFSAAADMAAGVVLALLRGRDAAAYNLGVAENHSLAVVARKIGNLLGYDEAVRFEQSAPSGPLGRIPDLAKTASELGLQPLLGLDDGLRETVAWYRGVIAPDSSVSSTRARDGAE